MVHISSPIVFVTYEGTSVSRFDRRYYVEQHLPLVMTMWERYGLLEVAAFFPPHGHVGTLVICECRFHNDAAIDAAFGSPETRMVMADLDNFTDIAPARLRVALI